MVSPLILAGSKGPRFLFNIGTNVGPRCPNRPDDVEFVQLGYFAMVRDPNNKSRLNATERSAFSKNRSGRGLQRGAAGSTDTCHQRT
jgi:hypothetical protein